MFRGFRNVGRHTADTQSCAIASSPGSVLTNERMGDRAGRAPLLAEREKQGTGGASAIS